MIKIGLITLALAAPFFAIMPVRVEAQQAQPGVTAAANRHAASSRPFKRTMHRAFGGSFGYVPARPAPSPLYLPYQGSSDCNYIGGPNDFPTVPQFPCR
jgi:hypothetical protein